MPDVWNIIAIVVFLIPYLGLSVKKLIISFEADDWPELVYRSGIAIFVSWVATTRWLVQGYGLFNLPQDHLVLNILLHDYTFLFMIIMLPACWIYFLHDRLVSGDSLEASHLVDTVKRKVMSGKKVLTLYRWAVWLFYFRVVILKFMTNYFGGIGNLPRNNKIYNISVGNEIFLAFCVALSLSYIIYLFANQYRVAKREALYN